MMTKYNEIRHILAKCKKCKTPEQYLYIHNFISDSEYLHHILEDRCANCQGDDFGRCLNTNDDNFFFKCLPQMIRLLEKDLLTSDISRKSKDNYASLKKKYFSDVPNTGSAEASASSVFTTDFLTARDQEILKVLECTEAGECSDNSAGSCKAITSAELLDLINRLVKANKELSAELEEVKIDVQSFKLKCTNALVAAKEMQRTLTEMDAKLVEFYN